MQSILTVTAAASSFNLTTVPMIKTELGITASGPNTWVDAKLPRASAAIASYCRRTLAKQTYSELFRLDGAIERIILSEYPVITLTSVTEDGVVLAATDYELDTDTGVLYRLCSDYRTCWTACKITVVYIAGFVLPGTASPAVRTLPQDLEDAALRLIKAEYNARQRDPMLKSQDIPGVIAETYWVGAPSDDSAAMPPEVTALLNPHRRPFI